MPVSNLFEQSCWVLAAVRPVGQAHAYTPYTPANRAFLAPVFCRECSTSFGSHLAWELPLNLYIIFQGGWVLGALVISVCIGVRAFWDHSQIGVVALI